MRATALEAYTFKSIWTVISSVYFVTTTGSSYAFGDNSFNQMGFLNTDSTYQFSPVSILTSFTAGDKSLMAVSGGIKHTLFLTTTGKVYGAGLDSGSYMLGLGTQTRIVVPPERVTGLPNNIKFLSSQQSTSIAVDSNNNIYAWGLNANQQVCISNNKMTVPTLVDQINVTVQSVQLSTQNIIIHYRDDSNKDMFQVCGNNTFGALGVLDATTALPPKYLNTTQWATMDFNPAGAIQSIHALDAATFALDSTGILYVVGDMSRAPGVPDYYTSLTGIKMYSDDKQTTEAMIETIAVGDKTSAAIERSTGKLFVFGGQTPPIALLTGGASNTHVYKPLVFPPLKGQNISNIVIGAFSSKSGNSIADTGYPAVTFFAVMNDTTKVYGWGSNEYHQLGQGYKNESYVPTVHPKIMKFRSNVTRVHKISASGRHILALTWEDTASNSVVDPNDPFAERTLFDFTVIGSNLNGELGMGSSIDIGTPLRVNDKFSVMDSAVGDIHSLRIEKSTSTSVITSTSSGTGPDGRLAAGILYDATSFRQVGLDSSSGTKLDLLKNVTVAKVFAGSKSSFFVTSTGAVYAAGDNTYGTLGFPATKPTIIYPTLVPGLESGVFKISSGVAGGAHTLFLMTDGTIYVTGRNNKGQLGLGDTIDRYSITKLPLPVNYVGLEVAAGSDHSMILLGQRKCLNDCSGRGDCNKVTGKCECGTSAIGTAYIGPDCSLRQCEDPKCSGHGTCQLDRGICKCNSLYKGAACAQRKCPNNCSGSLKGKCNTANGICVCETGWDGKDCSVSQNSASGIRVGVSFTLVIIALVSVWIQFL
jgi:alpha-tubulin suppressor-like RCC1 family protein